VKKLVVNKKVMGVIAVLCAAILPVAFALWSSTIFQTSDARLFVEPPSIHYESLVSGKRFSINITVANITDLKGYELKLSFNTVILDVVGISFLPEENLPVGNCAVDDSSGVVWLNVTYDGSPITTDNPVTLASLTFKMMDSGQSPLHLYDTELVDSSGIPVTHDTADGMVLILRHDIAIVEVSLSTNETYVGRVVNVTVITKNDGDVTENFTVNIYHNDTLFRTFNVTNLAPSENTTIIVSWNTSDVATGYSYIIKADASIIPHEVNITNNVFVDGEIKIKIIGDVSGDNTVDINDLIAWDMAWGSREGEPNWNLQADINGDDVVDNNDGLLIVQNYHSTV